MNIVKSFGNIFNSEAQCPVVDKTEEGFRIYYGRRDEKNRSRIFYINFDFNGTMFIPKFHHITPIVPLGKEGSFDEHGQIPSSIATIKGVKYLYYTGVRKEGENGYTNGIGLIRVEEEGFFKLKESVMIRDCTEWFASHLMANSVDRTYCSCREWRNDEPIYDLHWCSTEDGSVWEGQGEFLPLEKDEGGMCSFNIYGHEGVLCVRGKEDYRGGPESYKLHTAEWNIEGWKRTGRLEMPQEGWNNEMQCYPYIINNLLFYNGNNFGKTGIGCVLLGEGVS